MPSGLSARTSSADVDAGTTLHAAAGFGEIAQNVVFNAVIVGDDGKRRRSKSAFAFALRTALRRLALFVAAGELPHALVPVVGFGAGDVADQILADQSRRSFGLGDQLITVVAQGRDNAFLRAVIAQIAHQRARVDALNADDAVGLHVFVQRLGRAPVARLRRCSL